MRPCVSTILVLIAAATSTHAQAIASQFAWNRDYTFERLEATREVHDSVDNGTVRLSVYVWKPIKNDRHEVVLYSHGSTGGLEVGPREPGNYETPSRPLLQYFVERGYTVVAAARRGRGTSTGTYVEECSVYAGQCTPAQQLAMTDGAIAEALRDEDAVIDQLILGKMVPRGSQILLVGHSRGGFLSLLLAARRPDLAKGIVNFAGGWNAVTDRLSASELQERVNDHATRLVAAAKKVPVPTIWIYAARDPFYNDGGREAMVRAWRDAGGKAEYVFIAEHTLPNPHLVPGSPALWRTQMEAYLRGLTAAK